MILRMVLLLLFRKKIAQALIRDDKHCDFTMMTTTMAMTSIQHDENATTASDASGHLHSDLST